MSTRDASIESDEWEDEDYGDSLDDEGEDESQNYQRKRAGYNYKKESFSQISNWVMEVATPRGLQLYCILSKFANNDTKICWVLQSTLAEEMKCNVKTVARAIKELEEQNVIVKKRRFRRDGVERSSEFSLR